MTWTRLSDDFADHPELLNASRSARLLHVEALVYGNRHGNNGRFRRQLVARMTDAENWPDLVDELLDLGIWTDAGEGQLIIDWKAWEQEPAESVQARREANAERQRLFRERRDRHNAGDHSACTDNCRAKSRNASSAPSRNAPRDGTPTRSGPSRTEGEGGTDRTRGQTPATRSAGAPHATAVTPLRKNPPPGLVNAWDQGEEPAIVVNGEDA